MKRFTLLLTGLVVVASGQMHIHAEGHERSTSIFESSWGTNSTVGLNQAHITLSLDCTGSIHCLALDGYRLARATPAAPPN